MLNCSYCTYNTDRPYNLNRHIKHKHNSNDINNINTEHSGEKVALGGEKVALGGEKVALGGEKVALGGEKVALDGEKVALDDEKETLRCSECYKTFTRYRNLLQHKSICKKVHHVNECIQCHKVFAQKYGLYKHKKICKGLPLIPYVSPSEQPNQISTDTDAKNIVIQNNNSTNTLINNSNSNNTSTNNININVFPTSLHTDYSIQTDHFSLKELKKNIRKQSTFEAIGTSLRMVLQNTNNLPVKKKNLRSDNSYVHVGDNKWEIRKDNEVFGLISFHISRCFQVYLDGTNLSQLRTFYQEATEALEFVASDNIQYLERESIQMAKRIMDILLLRAYEVQNIEPS